MTKTQQLNELFDEWERAFPEVAGRFKRDGIIDEALFDQSVERILFIAKEPNDTGGSDWDFRNWWKNEVKYSFSHRISEWAYGLQHGFPPYRELPLDQETRKRTLLHIAFMNLKKVGGGATADVHGIEDTVQQQGKFLRRQLEIICPTLIIGCIGSESSAWQELMPGIEFVDSGYEVPIAQYRDCRVISFYHPSTRAPKTMSYASLKAVVESSVFRSLRT